MDDCLFCAIVAADMAAHVVYADDTVTAFLDTRPVFPGHVLVVPRAHIPTLAELPADMLSPYFADVQRIAQAVEDATGAAGTFVAINNKVSQSVAHLHTHVVPRNRKDGLRGFFWPRTRYRDDAHAADVAAAIRTALADQEPDGPRRRAAERR